MAYSGLHYHRDLHTQSSPVGDMDSPPTPNTHITAAATVGIVFGVLAILALITLFVMYAYRRRMRLRLRLRPHVDIVTIVKPSHKAAVHLDLNAAHPIDEEKAQPDWWRAPASRSGSREALVAPYASPPALDDTASDVSYPHSYNPPSLDAPLSRPSSALIRATTERSASPGAWSDGLSRDPFARTASQEAPERESARAPLHREVVRLREEIQRMKAILEGKTTKAGPVFTVANATAADGL
ncbi:hypothetical protein OBBRIDRAFT_432352 [Obba rivulosa]|uniref:Uncharacterized protein n=1 Tax=Obba rivulosa TaxID=1052685 RepID=A0A8E2AGP4_9APHY|nr:hypothetical protein OBBRIDRAFT_432352 [Obba rivulosa]